MRQVALIAACLALGGCITKTPEAPSSGPSDPEPTQSPPTSGVTRCETPETLSTEFYGKADFPTPACRTSAKAWLDRLTLEEKVGQMLQPSRDQLQQDAEIAKYFLGSVLSGGGGRPQENTPIAWARMVEDYRQHSLGTRLGIPMLYAVDAVHGHNNVEGAVIFPHNIGLGASRDIDLVRRVAAATASEVYATNIHWTFAPVLAAARDERWGRTYEAFGESYELCADLGAAAVKGYQGERLGKSPHSILATAKHFVGDGNTEGGKDQGNANLTPDQIEQDLLPAYGAAIAAGVGSVMASFSSINGVKMHCNGPLLTDALKRRMGFNGFVVSDWQALEQLAGNSYEEQLTSGIVAGVDMVMHSARYPEVATMLKDLVPGSIPIERIDDAVTRILAIKCELGMLKPDAYPKDSSAESRLRPDVLRLVGSEPHRALAREAVAKSLVLLKNAGKLLPLSRDLPGKLLVVGEHADNIGLQSGGWTIDWQGGSGPITQGTTILQGLIGALGKERVAYSLSGDGAEPGSTVIAVVGEPPYAEGKGDDPKLALNDGVGFMLERLKKQGAKIVLVLISGRPMILGPILDHVDALVAAWLPGTEGGGIADVLFGDKPFAGKLSHSWPKNIGQVPINVGDERYDPLFEYGFGLRE